MVSFEANADGMCTWMRMTRFVPSLNLQMQVKQYPDKGYKAALIKPNKNKKRLYKVITHKSRGMHVQWKRKFSDTNLKYMPTFR